MAELTEKALELKRANAKEWRENNRESVRKYNREWRQKNKE